MKGDNLLDIRAVQDSENCLLDLFFVNHVHGITIKKNASTDEVVEALLSLATSIEAVERL